MTADSLGLTAYRPDKDRIRFVEGTADRSRRTADSSGRTASVNLTRGGTDGIIELTENLPL